MYEDKPPDATAGPWMDHASPGINVQRSFPGPSQARYSSPDPSTATSPRVQSPPAHTTYSDNSLSASQQTPWWLRESRKHATPESVKLSIPPGSTLDAQIDKRTRPAGPQSDFSTDKSAAGPSTYDMRKPFNNVPMGKGPIHLQTRLSRRERALWIWLNVEDLDSFLQDVNMSPLNSL